jgi:hypothetical protein
MLGFFIFLDFYFILENQKKKSRTERLYVTGRKAQTQKFKTFIKQIKLINHTYEIYTFTPSNVSHQ